MKTAAAALGALRPAAQGALGGNRAASVGDRGRDRRAGESEVVFRQLLQIGLDGLDALHELGFLGLVQVHLYDLL